MDVDQALKKAENLNASYVEVRYEDITKNHLELKDGVFSTFTEKRLRGYGIRVLANGAWGFATINSDKVEEGIESAYRMALAASRGIREKIELSPIEIVEDYVKSRMKIKPQDVSLDEKIERMKRLERNLKKTDEVKSTQIRYEDAHGKKIITTSEGMRIEFDVNYIFHYLWVTGLQGDKRGAVRNGMGFVDEGWEAFGKISMEELATKMIKKLRNQMNGVSSKRGEYPIVASPIVIGIIAHEALGHLAEADLTVNSPFKELIGKKIAPEYVSMSDRFVQKGFGNAKYDDEGTRVRDVHIIKNGILKEIMLNREYAKRWCMEPNGHARAENYTYPPIIRMRNTVFEPCDYSFEELLEGIKFGYYLADYRGGQAELNSAFQVGIQEGYVIRNGEIAEPIKDTSISGIAIESLKNISAIGKDFGIEYGICGKGQNAFVSSGGPHIRFDRSIVIGGKK